MIYSIPLSFTSLTNSIFLLIIPIDFFHSQLHIFILFLIFHGLFLLYLFFLVEFRVLVLITLVIIAFLELFRIIIEVLEIGCVPTVAVMSSSTCPCRGGEAVYHIFLGRGFNQQTLILLEGKGLFG